MHHFGEPLVSTPSDFGTRSTPPSHPELLDWLAWTFMHEGWSLKKLHRHIVLSATYQQASFDRPDARKVDPENRLFWRANRRRLDFEAMRDSLLVSLRPARSRRSAAGRSISPTMPKNAARTVYGLVDRQSLPGLFRAFDFAMPGSIGRAAADDDGAAASALRHELAVRDRAGQGARRPHRKAGRRTAQVREFYRLVHARAPEPRKCQAALRFMDDAQDPNARNCPPGSNSPRFSC